MKKLGAGLILFLCGCTVGPVYEVPDVAIPCTWQSEVSSSSTICNPDELIWWETLGDPLLNELMEYAAQQNLDLKIAAMRVLQARSEAKAKKGDLYPHIDGSMNYGHVYYSKDALVNGLLGTALPVDSHNVRRNVNFYEVGFDVDWELDFFGKTAHDIAALQAHEQAVQEELCAIWVTLSAEIAKNYIELRGAQKQVELGQRNIALEEQSFTLSKELLSRGLIDESRFNQSAAEIERLKGDIYPLKSSILRSMHRLAILLGYPPGDLYDCLCGPQALPELPSSLALGVPSELLRRRPDIRKAERELAAATERIGSAIAALFPRFSLRGFVGDISTHTGSLFSPASATWFVGPQVLLPIFNSRLLLQDVDYNKIATQEALYRYQKVVLEALEESENSISSYLNEEKRRQHLTKSLQSYESSWKIAQSLYSQGVNDLFAVAQSEKKFLNLELISLQARVDQLLNYISLYKALGGSWKSD